MPDFRTASLRIDNNIFRENISWLRGFAVQCAVYSSELSVEYSKANHQTLSPDAVSGAVTESAEELSRRSNILTAVLKGIQDSASVDLIQPSIWDWAIKFMQIKCKTCTNQTLCCSSRNIALKAASWRRQMNCGVEHWDIYDHIQRDAPITQHG